MKTLTVTVVYDPRKDDYARQWHKQPDDMRTWINARLRELPGVEQITYEER